MESLPTSQEQSLGGRNPNLKWTERGMRGVPASRKYLLCSTHKQRLGQGCVECKAMLPPAVERHDFFSSLFFFRFLNMLPVLETKETGRRYSSQPISPQADSVSSCNPGQQRSLFPASLHVTPEHEGTLRAPQAPRGPPDHRRPASLRPTAPAAGLGPVSSCLDLQPHPAGHSAAICPRQRSLSQSGHFQVYNGARRSPSPPAEANPDSHRGLGSLV